MAKKFNADQAFEPLEITINGKEYRVVNFTKEKFDKVAALADEAKGSNDIGVLQKQLGILLDTDPGEFLSTDLRILAGALKFITDEIAPAGGKQKNG